MDLLEGHPLLDHGLTAIAVELGALGEALPVSLARLLGSPALGVAILSGVPNAGVASGRAGWVDSSLAQERQVGVLMNFATGVRWRAR